MQNLAGSDAEPLRLVAWPGYAGGSAAEMTVVVDDRQAFTLENFRRVAYARERVRIGQKATRTMAQARESFFAMLEADPTIFVYGVTSSYGMGASQRVTFDARQRRQPPSHRTHGG